MVSNKTAGLVIKIGNPTENKANKMYFLTFAPHGFA
jgi:hypothetical protein